MTTIDHKLFIVFVLLDKFQGRRKQGFNIRGTKCLSAALKIGVKHESIGKVGKNAVK